jgi:hypothetical protein
MTRNPLGPLLIAASAIPGIGLEPARAGTPPDETSFAFKYLDYFDYQKDRDRMRVRAPMIWLNAPAGSDGEIAASAVVDSISGASPYYLNAVSGASGRGIRDLRRALDARYTRHLDRLALSVGLAASTEDDYRSRAASVDLRLDSDDRNTTAAVGASVTADRISSTNDPSLREDRTTRELLLGVTQVLTPRSVIQSNLVLGAGEGYFTDPYKFSDRRPSSRQHTAWLTRHRLYLPRWQAALHSDYRYYRNSWSVHAHSLDLAWYQPFAGGWTVRPGLRYYSQSAADFFSPVFPPSDPNAFYSADQRLAAFGAVTVGLKIEKKIGRRLALDAGYDYYVQKPQWRLGGNGTDSLEPFYARLLAVGASWRF